MPQVRAHAINYAIFKAYLLNFYTWSKEKNYLLRTYKDFMQELRTNLIFKQIKYKYSILKKNKVLGKMDQLSAVHRCFK